MINKAIIVGRLGNDPEVRYTQSGTAIANFNVATTERWKDKDGQMQEQTEWHKCSAFAKLAEICGEYLHKGSLIYCEGRIQTRSWDDKDGNKKYTTEIILKEMKMLDGKKGDSSNQNKEKPNNQEPTEPILSDDVPF